MGKLLGGAKLGGGSNTCVYAVANCEDLSDFRGHKIYDEKMDDVPKVRNLEAPEFSSPPGRLRFGASLAVVGEKIYLVGGRTREPIVDSTHESRVDCFDIRKGLWTECSPLNMARDGVQLVAKNNNKLIYAFGSSIAKYVVGYGGIWEYISPDDGPWAEVFDVKNNKWSPINGITPTTSALPWRLFWCVTYGKTILLYGADPDRSTQTIFKLFQYDFNTKECRIYDEDFCDKFIAVAKQYHGRLGHLEILLGSQRRMPTKHSNLLYFTFRGNIYCYDMTKKKWQPQRMAGFDPTCLIPKCCMDPSAYFRFKIVKLSGKTFCVTWVDEMNLYFTKFEVSCQDGIPMASNFSEAVVFKLHYRLSTGEMASYEFGLCDTDCFAIKHN